MSYLQVRAIMLPLPLLAFTAGAAAPALPTLPDSFSAVVEANIMEKNYSTTVWEHYDYEGNRSRFDMHDRHSGAKLSVFEFYGYGKEYRVKGGSACTVGAVPGGHSHAMGHADGEGRMRRSSDIFQFGPQFKELYLGQRTARGILCDVWSRDVGHAGHRPAGHGHNATDYTMNYTLTYSFAADHWTYRTATDPLHPLPHRVPVRAELAGQMAAGPVVQTFHHYYDYVSFAVGRPAPSTFQLPRAAVCTDKAAIGAGAAAVAVPDAVQPHGHAFPAGVDAACMLHSCEAELRRCTGQHSCHEAMHCMMEGCKPFTLECAQRCGKRHGLADTHHVAKDGSTVAHAAGDGGKRWADGGSGKGDDKGEWTGTKSKEEWEKLKKQYAEKHGSDLGRAGHGTKGSKAHAPTDGAEATPPTPVPAAGMSDTGGDGGAYFGAVLECMEMKRCLAAASEWGFGVSSACAAHQCGAEQMACQSHKYCRKVMGDMQAHCTPFTANCAAGSLAKIESGLLLRDGVQKEHVDMVALAKRWRDLVTCFHKNECSDEWHHTAVSLKMAEQDEAMAAAKSHHVGVAVGVAFAMLLVGAVLGQVAVKRFHARRAGGGFGTLQETGSRGNARIDPVGRMELDGVVASAGSSSGTV